LGAHLSGVMGEGLGKTGELSSIFRSETQAGPSATVDHRMASHYSCVGLDVPDAAAFEGLVRELWEASTRSQGPLGTRMLWHDSVSGACLAVYLDDEDVVCANPTFAGHSHVSVRPTAMVDDPEGCSFCAVATVEILENDEMAYPLAVELDDIHMGPLSSNSGLIELSISAFGEAVEVWSSVEEYGAAATEGPKFAPQSLIPSGLFVAPDGDQRVRAKAIITGIVADAERRVNAHTGTPFEWCQLDTYAATLDVVLEHRSQALRTGQVVQGTFWLVAHRPVDDVAPRAGRRWFGRKQRS